MNENNKIKNIIFDFGDVILNLDKSATQRELNKLGFDQFDLEMEKMNALYETGKISTTKLLDFYQKKIPGVSKEKLIDAWNSILLDLPVYRLDFIKEMAKKYHIFLLSNINELHEKHIRKMLGEELYADFLNIFEKVFYSHIIQMRKPDKTPFEFIINSENLKPSETIFIDDIKENCDTAEQLGFKTWNINPKTEDIINLQNQL